MSLDKLSIEELYGSRFVEGNSLKLLYKGRASFNAIFRGIEAAQKFICLQFYIFRNDETGNEIARLLKKKAEKGISVYILYDHFGSISTPASFWKNLKTSGINIRASRPLKWLSPLHYVHRDHRKLLIVDGVTAFTGGLNIANEYRGFHLRLKRENWRDTGVMLKGPIVPELVKTFNSAWSVWGGSPLKTEPTKQWSVNNMSDNNVAIIPIFTASAKSRRKMRKLLYYSINHSKESILLTTAYFTPSKRMLDTLEEAVRRGVDVKLLLPGKSDVPAAYYAGRAFFARLLRRGVSIYNYQGDVLHAKTYVFDGCWSIVGSANLDFMSLRRNDEGNVGILDTKFGSKMKALFEEDLAHSIEITETDWLKRPIGVRLKEKFFALFRRRL